ncbi:MAG TPA: hypothetical protein ENI22_02245 [Candidatus Pacearchaeota archaeon]|nr:hypothetical protein [Candidatus Pacearchaeota archaeon]
MAERGNISGLESMYLNNREKLSVIVGFSVIESLVFFLGYIATSGKFKIGESNEELAYSIGTAALMGLVGFLGIKSYRNTKWQKNQ